MQPETAFWMLSTIAQASAALAGITALLLVFLLTQAARDQGENGKFGLSLIISADLQLVAFATGAFLLAVIVSISALGGVTPGPEPVGLAVLTAAYSALGLVAAASFLLVLFLVISERWT